jgi:hypothetical protein
MNNQRKKLLSKLNLANPAPEERILTQLTIERICADMCDFYEKFYAQEGPGTIVYVPDAEKEEDSMFFLSVDCLISAVDDLSRQELEGPAEVMRKAIARAEALDPDKEALFIIQDKEHLALVHYNREKSASKLTIT